MQTVYVYVKTKSKNVNEEKTVTNSFQSSFVYSLRILYFYNVFGHVDPSIFSRFPHVPLQLHSLHFSPLYNPSNLSCSYKCMGMRSPTGTWTAFQGPQPWGKLTLSPFPSSHQLPVTSSSAGGGYWWATPHWIDLVPDLCWQPQLHSLLKYVNYACVCKNLVKENKWEKEKL